MRKKILIITVLYLSLSAFSQNKIEKIGSKTKFKVAEYYESMLQLDDPEYFYQLRYNTIGKGYNYYIEKISKKDLEVKNEFLIGKSRSFFILKNKCYIFTGEKVADKFVKYLKIMNLHDGTILKDNILLAENATDRRTSFNVFTFLNADSTKLVVVNKETEDNIENIKYDLYDVNSLEKLGSKNLPNQYQNSNTISSDFKVDKIGNLFCFFQYEKYDKKKVVEDFGLFKYEFATDKKNVYKINFNSKNIMYNQNYTIGDNSVVYIYSMIKDNSTDAKAKNQGFHVIKLNSLTLDKISEKSISFTNEMFSRLTCNDPNKEIEGGYKPFIKMINGNEIFLVADRHVNGVFDGKSFTEGNEIVVAKFNASLDLAWIKLLPRATSFTSNTTLYKENSTKMMSIFSKDKLTFVYLEYPGLGKKDSDYETASICEVPFTSSFRNTNCVAYTMDLNGNISKKIVFFNDEDFLVPGKEVIKAGENKYIVRFCKDRKESFGILSLE